MMRERLYLFDTTLRDGAQTTGVDFSLEDKRKIAESLVKKITNGDKEIDITFSYLPSSEKACINQQKLGRVSSSFLIFHHNSIPL